jgi:hypothetical protein
VSTHIGPLRFGRWEHTASRRGGIRYNIGQVIWLAAIVVALILLVGVAFVWWNANPGNELVRGVMRAGTWLATPFRDVFTPANARDRLTENWALAAGVYLVGGRILTWLVGH